MKIPKNITAEHLKKAISKIDKEGIPNDGQSQYYDVVLENGNRYPPKLVLSYANIFANGSELERTKFRGGLNTPCFNILEENGFNIETKQPNGEYHTELKNFILQAKEEDLKTKHFTKNYKGLEVKVSFGQGVPARIPWISFLKKPFTTSDGIYPVYLYYKKLEILILAYGKSETNKPEVKWNIENPQTISNYFHKHSLGQPKRYGDSLIFKVYDANNLPSNSILDEDLNKILDQYVQLGNMPSKSQQKNTSTRFNISSFSENLDQSGLLYEPQLIGRYVSSLITKPFVLLSGLSGSGKTKLAQAFTQWISQDKSQYAIVPVGADWTNREPLLGYVNALNDSDYVLPENGALKLLIEANKEENQNKPYFLILDEMNLSHVERYFADFLSVMETKDQLRLHDSEKAKNGVPSHLSWTNNLFIVGTVNIDETTYMFSPKVLDRANVIEFRVTKDQIKKFLDISPQLDLAKLIGKGSSMGEDFISLANKKDFPSYDTVKLNEKLVDFFDELKKTGSEFGYRTASEIHRLYNQLSSLDREMSENDKIDIAIMQKLLPKLHGSRRKLSPILEVLASFCVEKEADLAKDFFNNKETIIYKDNPQVLYPLSLEKITRMYQGAVDNGFASYAEA